ncbi:hypothetical protein [Caldimonas tepidiphila]|nr:hypothetical protein [Caldimonas tepidiphila]
MTALALLLLLGLPAWGLAFVKREARRMANREVLLRQAGLWRAAR